MNFANVTSITIPEGSVSRILKGSEVLWEKVTSLLPAAYQQVEYIECTGTQYIDTGVIASDYPGGIRYVFRGRPFGYMAAANNNYLFGCLNNGLRSGNVSLHTGNNYVSVYLGNNSAALLTKRPLPELATDIEVILTATSEAAASASATLNGEALTRGYTPTNTAMPSASIYLLYCRGVGEASKPFWGRLYSLTMDKPDGTPIRSFIPCRRKADKVLGAFDTVGQTFHTNIGTGTFTAGPEV